LTHIISTGNSRVAGVTSMADQLFVVHLSPQQQIEVYDTATFSLQRKISVPGFGRSYGGLVSCTVNNCLYVSDDSQNTVYRVELSSTNGVAHWKVANRPWGLSLTKVNNVFVCCCSDLKLQEFTSQGLLVREVSLQCAGIRNLLFALALDNNQFVISSDHQVNVVDAKGRIVSTVGSTSAGSAVGQLYNPRGLVRCANGNILIADYSNNRITVVNSSLSDARILDLPADVTLQGAWALFLDESRERLYVGEWNSNRLLVFDNVFSSDE
jgi:hypothetical protein